MPSVDAKWCKTCHGLTLRLANGKCQYWREHKRLVGKRLERMGM